ncbi:MAG: PIN domain-containing protein [Bacteroidia bacterium]
MKVFIDANVLIAVVNKEYPAFDACSRVLSLAADKRFTLFVSTLSLGICWYFAEKKSGRTIANEKIRLIMKHFSISDCGQKEALAAISEKKADDFEDAIQVHSAKSSACSSIVTLNERDFYFTNLEVINPLDFLYKYV